MNKTIANCPSCGGPLMIKRYGCPSCGTEVQGSFTGCPYCSMPDEDRYFSLVFLQCEGNMKDVESVMGISYPTIKSRLSRIKKYLDRYELAEKPSAEESREEASAGEPEVAAEREKRLGILEALEKGEIEFTKALDLIKDLFKK